MRNRFDIAPGPKCETIAKEVGPELLWERRYRRNDDVCDDPDVVVGTVVAIVDGVCGPWRLVCVDGPVCSIVPNQCSGRNHYHGGIISRELAELDLGQRLHHQDGSPVHSSSSSSWSRDGRVYTWIVVAVAVAVVDDRDNSSIIVPWRDNARLGR